MEYKHQYVLFQVNQLGMVLGTVPYRTAWYRNRLSSKVGTEYRTEIMVLVPVRYRYFQYQYRLEPVRMEVYFSVTKNKG